MDILLREIKRGVAVTTALRSKWRALTVDHDATFVAEDYELVASLNDVKLSTAAFVDELGHAHEALNVVDAAAHHSAFARLGRFENLIHVCAHDVTLERASQ